MVALDLEARDRVPDGDAVPDVPEHSDRVGPDISGHVDRSCVISVLGDHSFRQDLAIAEAGEVDAEQVTIRGNESSRDAGCVFVAYR